MIITIWIFKHLVTNFILDQGSKIYAPFIIDTRISKGDAKKVLYNLMYNLSKTIKN